MYAFFIHAFNLKSSVTVHSVTSNKKTISIASKAAFAYTE